MTTDVIDITFDFRTDTPAGKDPDTYSHTLLKYHRLLWSKRLPNGKRFNLDVTTRPPMYLHHLSELGDFWLSSDTMTQTFRWLAQIIDQMAKGKLEEFHRVSYTIGGMVVFPANRIDNKMTLNGARGCHPKIRDRFDLTLECIRRHYLDEPNPLSNTLTLYADFFRLFRNFPGYVDFFHLQDLVNEATSTVKFFTPFEDFAASPLPETLDAYVEYRERAIEFIDSRNRRIADYTRRIDSPT
jgi:hypothetical protein